jgi:hypothetical protein
MSPQYAIIPFDLGDRFEARFPDRSRSRRARILTAACGARNHLGARNVFAKDAVRAALWCASKPAGLYSMRDVLGLE